MYAEYNNIYASFQAFFFALHVMGGELYLVISPTVFLMKVLFTFQMSYMYMFCL